MSAVRPASWWARARCADGRPSARFGSLAIVCCLILLPVAARAQATSGASEEVRKELKQVLAVLATSAERTTMGGRMGYAGDSPPDVINLCRAVRMLAALSTSERYDVLKQWMLPSEPGALERHAMCFAPVEVPPELFFHSGESTDVASALPASIWTDAAGDGVIYFSEMLVNAARDCGKLEELVEAAESAGKSAQMADALSVLAGLALQRDERVRQETATFVDDLRQKAAATGQLHLEPWPTYMIARAWMRDEKWGDQGEALARLLVRYVPGTQQRSFVSHLHRDLARYRVRKNGGDLAAGAEPGLMLWHPGGYYFTSGAQAGTWPGWWVEDSGTIVHLSGPEISPLYFACPVTGEFELAVDAFPDAALQYGRLVFEPAGNNDKARMLTIGERESAEPPNAQLNRDRPNRLAIRVSPQKVSYLCNGAVVYEDALPSPATPWLALFARSTRTTAWGNLQITGHPRVPREVNLIDGDRLEGWMSPLYRENIPPQLRSVAPAARGDSTTAASKQGYVWYAAEGVLHGSCTKSSNPNMAIQSWLNYHRSLRSGDVLTYEFFYQPSERMVHPALGRIAFVLEPDGVRLHWITEVPHMALGGLTADNAITIASSRRGARPLPLKSGQWNTMTIRITDDVASLVLNGTEIYEHPLTAADHRMFGFFHYKNRTAVEARHIVLTGKWPEQLTDQQLAHPAVRAPLPETPENQRSRQALVNPPFPTAQDQR